jgi:aminoglycoside 6'-N-acetyltransferase
LYTERLVVRAYTPADASRYAAIRSDPDVARYQGWSVPFPLERAERFMADLQGVQAPPPGEWFSVAICDAASGEVIGDVAVHRDGSFPTAEIGYTLEPAWWGRGLATEAVGAVIGWLFDTQGLRRIEAQTHPDNAGSIAVLCKLGFVHEGTKRLSYGPDDDASDDAIFGLLRTEWRGQPGGSR